MSKHDHKHSCECSHESVKYCKTCKIVHCADCNLEWSQRPTYTYGSPWYQGYLGSSAIPMTSSGGMGSNNGQSLDSSNLSNQTLCDHKA